MNKIILILMIIRLIWTLYCQLSYIHPDEYFQSLEIISSNIFNITSNKIHKTWEFNESNPIRNILIPFIIYSPNYYLLKLLINLNIINSINSYILIILPRLSITLISFINDYLLIKISNYLKINKLNVLILFNTSYITFTYLTHTFSNSIELTLFTCLIYLLIRVSKSNQSTIIPLMLLSLILVTGIFNRPTFIIYSFIPCLYLIIKLNLIKLILLSLISLLISLIFILIDTLYYTGQSLSISLIVDNLILTPVNFIIYNKNSENLIEHGEHTIYQHILINCFQLFFLNHFIIIISFIRQQFKKTRSNRNDHDVIIKLLNIIYLFVLLIFSLIKHKESRFLIPLLIPLILITSKLNIKFKLIKYQWFLFNFIFVIIFGILHQGGLVQSLNYIQNMFKHKLNNQINQHVLFYSTYMPPKFLINIPLNIEYSYQQLNNNNKKREIYDLMSNTHLIQNQIDSIINENKNDNLALFLITPNIINLDSLNLNMTNIKFNLHMKFYYHLQFDNLVDYYNYYLNNCLNLSYIKCFYNLLSLSMYQIVVY